MQVPGIVGKVSNHFKPKPKGIRNNTKPRVLAWGKAKANSTSETLHGLVNTAGCGGHSGQGEDVCIRQSYNLVTPGGLIIGTCAKQKLSKPGNMRKGLNTRLPNSCFVEPRPNRLNRPEFGSPVFYSYISMTIANGDFYSISSKFFTNGLR